MSGKTTVYPVYTVDHSSSAHTVWEVGIYSSLAKAKAGVEAQSKGRTLYGDKGTIYKRVVDDLENSAQPVAEFNILHAEEEGEGWYDTTVEWVENEIKEGE